jgi:RNase P/RNase MRP subunit POP5
MIGERSSNSIKEVIKIHIYFDLWMEKELLSTQKIAKVLREQYWRNHGSWMIAS